MSEDLKIKTISGLTWSAIDNIASQGIVFIIGANANKRMRENLLDYLGLKIIQLILIY